MPRFERIVNVLTWIGISAIIIMVLITVMNVVGRMFGLPMPGAFELIVILGAVSISGMLTYTTILKRHIVVDLVVSRLPIKTRRIADLISGIISSLIMFLIAYQTVVIGVRDWGEGVKSDILKVPLSPILYFVALCFLINGIAFLQTGIKSLFGDARK